jgi:hypothetical protein
MEAPEKIYVSTDPFGCLHAYDCENHPPIVVNSIYIDYRGLIPKGLAIEVTEENNPYK